MNLIDKLNTIDIPEIPSFSQGYSFDIQTFYNQFIKPRLPSQEIILKWNILLQEYANLSDAIYPVRAFYNRDENFIEIEKDDELRRGFLTKFDNADFALFFTDNFFVAYIEKMLLDNYCPSLNEFYDLMVSRKFPARFGKSCESERRKAAYKIDGKNPGLNSAGYKIAHIVDTGKHYSYPESSSLKELAELFDFGRGKYSDWKESSDSNGKCYIRMMNSRDPVKTKEILKTHFFRLTNPMNYFLTPKMRKEGRIYNEFRNLKNETKYDIAEYKNLQNYVHDQYVAQYGKQYIDFLNLIHLPENYFSKSDGTEKIRIYYGNPLKKESFINQIPSKIVNKAVNVQKTKGLPFEENEIVLCTFIARYGATSKISIDTVYKIKKRSEASISMKIQNIASMLDEEGISRFTNTNALTGLTTGHKGRRTNWDIVQPLCKLSKNELESKCLAIIKEINT